MKNTRCDVCQKETPGIEGEAVGFWYVDLRLFKNEKSSSPTNFTNTTPQQNASVEACSPECLRIAVERAVEKKIAATLAPPPKPA